MATRTIAWAVLLGMLIFGGVLMVVEFGFHAYEDSLRRRTTVIDIRCPNCGTRVYETVTR